MANKNIKFAGFLNHQKLRQVLSQTKALIYCSIEEDFGMIPIEIMSYGIPVIAYNSGEIKETIINEKTGILFNKYKPQSLINAIKKFEQQQFKSRDCINQANKFSDTIFDQKLLKLTKKNLKIKGINL